MLRLLSAALLVFLAAACVRSPPNEIAPGLVCPPNLVCYSAEFDGGSCGFAAERVDAGCSIEGGTMHASVAAGFALKQYADSFVTVRCPKTTPFCDVVVDCRCAVSAKR